MDLLEKERAELEILLGHRRNSLSAMRKLPAELWAKIFTEVSRSEEHALSATHQKITAPSVVLSQVCSRWREIIHNLPQLWTSISVDLFNLGADIQGLINSFLRRSKSHPLKIYIHYSDTRNYFRDPPRVTKNSRMVFRTLMAHVERCIEFRCELDVDIITALESSNLVFSCPLLRTFECHSDMPSTGRPGWFFEILEKTASNLEVVKVSTALGLHVVPYPHLTMLSIDGHNGAGRLFELLRSCVSLRSLLIEEFETDMFVGEEAMTFAPVVLPTLQRFSVGLGPDYSHSAFGPLFSTLSLPSLEALEIKSNPDIEDNDEWPLSLLTILQSASSTLKELSFGNHVNLAGDSLPLHGILQSCPNLCRLSFLAVSEEMYSTFIHDLFAVLTLSQSMRSAANVAPKLTHLELHFTYGYGFEAEVMLSMAESRANTSCLSDTTALQDIRIVYDEIFPAKKDWNPFKRAHLKKRLDDLKDKGLHFCFLFPSEGL